MDTLEIRTSSRVQFADITNQVRDTLSKSGVREGLVTVFVPHTTAGVTINEAADPSVVQDMAASLTGLVPHHAGYRHSEGNSDAHIKATIVGSSVNVIVAQGKLALGTWQGIFFCEFDGPRTRKVWVKIISG